MKAFLDLGWGRRFKEQFERLPKIHPSFLNRITLASHVQFRAQRNVPTAFALDNRRKLPVLFHIDYDDPDRSRVNCRVDLPQVAVAYPA
jgi:hypothetical protein